MLSAETLKQIKKIQLKAGRQVTGDLAGNYVSAFRGQGMEFDEVREYVVGDDVRSIDWNVTARTGQPHVKVWREERELTLMLLVDVSPSQAFGTGGRAKRECASELAAVLAFLAIRNNDKVGLITFSDHVEAYIPPKKGRSHVWNIIRSIFSHEPRGTRTDLSEALGYLLRVQKRRGTVFVVSDFWTEGYERLLGQAALKHDMTAIVTEDPAERELPDAGVVGLRDRESGEVLAVDTSDPRVRREWREQDQRRRQRLAQLFARHRVGRIDVSTDAPVTGPLLSYFRRRERRA